jgi:5,6-dimethylbenzimidazole synthase
VGHVEEFYRAPMLELERWDQRMPVQQVLYQDSWGEAAP